MAYQHAGVDHGDNDLAAAGGQAPGRWQTNQGVVPLQVVVGVVGRRGKRVHPVIEIGGTHVGALAQRLDNPQGVELAPQPLIAPQVRPAAVANSQGSQHGLLLSRIVEGQQHFAAGLTRLQVHAPGAGLVRKGSR